MIVEVEWLPSIDKLIRHKFNELTIEKLREEILVKHGIDIPELLILHRAEELGLIGSALKELERGKKPPYLKSQKVWLQGAETIRIKGDITIPAKEFVPYNLIVCGNLTTKSDVVIKGGIHVKGDALIGPRNGIGRSLVVEGDLVIGGETVIGNCVDAHGSVYVARGVVIGIAREGGGLVSSDAVYMERGTLGKTKIYAAKGIRVVDSLREILPEKFKVADLWQAQTKR
ncbi:MAG: hypothetical protein DRO00_02265 [Thermoproteota archaeon]|nr:MAG: hypothetical protein DRO00_02265 [Candidatus Korarchaeota archaeon]